MSQNQALNFAKERAFNVIGHVFSSCVFIKRKEIANLLNKSKGYSCSGFNKMTTKIDHENQ